MKWIAISVAAVLAVGLAAAAYVWRTPPPPAAPDTGAVEYFDSSAAVEERVSALETAVAEERDARQTLEDELQILYAEIDRLSAAAGPPSAAIPGDDVPEPREELERRRARRGDEPADRRDRLVAGGFTPDRAEWIVQRESELRLAAMQEVFDLRRQGEDIDRFDPRLNPDAALRAEIGDAEYENYLAANGRPTSVTVSSVLESSPGQQAGLQPGDEIVSYGGQRVFNSWELNRTMLEGDEGQSVVVSIRRDGVPMQIVLPRGPIGITARRGFGPR